MIYNNKKDWKKTLVFNDQTIEEVLKSLKSSGLQIVLVINKSKKLVGTITDGDLREFILKKFDLNIKAKLLMNKKPVYAKKNFEMSKILDLMKKKQIYQVPIVDSNQKVIGLEILQNLINDNQKRNENFIFMAGGKGLRLRPITKKIPKPMIKVYGKPILEHLIINVKKQGFTNIYISTHYLQKKIKDYFKDGKKLKLNIKYLNEKKPLGTGGVLSKINKKEISENFVVSNSDIISNINFVEAISYHKKNKADITLLTKNFLTRHKFSIIDNNGKILKKIDEKPTTFVNYGIGVYIFNKKILKYVGRDKYINMIEFIKKFQNNKNLRVLTYPINEDWKDIGSPLDLQLLNQ